MFRLGSTDLKGAVGKGGATASRSYSSGFVSLLGTTGLTANATTSSISSPYFSSGSSLIGSSFGSSYFFSLGSNGIESLRVLTVGGKVYGGTSNIGNISSGNFDFNSSSGSTSVSTADGSFSLASREGIFVSSTNVLNNSVAYSGVVESVEYNSGDSIPTNFCPKPYPTFLKDWNVQGTVSLTRSFAGHPSASLVFETFASREKEVRETLRNGLEVNLFGILFFVNALTIQKLSLREYPGGIIEVSVDFQGKWAQKGNTSRNSLDKPIRLRSSRSQKGDRFVNIGSICRRIGVVVVGTQGLQPKKIPVNTPSSTTVTARQLLESYAITGQKFVYYSVQNPELRLWARTQIHELSSAEIESFGAISIPGHGATVDCTQLTNEYRNTELQLDSFNDDDDDQNEITVRWEFENARNFADVSIIPFIPEGFTKDDLLKDPTNSYPVSNRLKKARKITEKNGTQIKAEEWVYSLAFLSTDTYSVLNNSILYDSNTLIGVLAISRTN